MNLFDGRSAGRRHPAFSEAGTHCTAEPDTLRLPGTAGVFTSPTGGVRSTAISVSAGVSVCLLAYLENYTPQLYQIFCKYYS